MKSTEKHDPNRIKKALIDHGLDQTQLAKRLGVHRNTVVSSINFGLNKPTLTRIKIELGLN